MSATQPTVNTSEITCSAEPHDASSSLNALATAHTAAATSIARIRNRRARGSLDKPVTISTVLRMRDAYLRPSDDLATCRSASPPVTGPYASPIARGD